MHIAFKTFCLIFTIYLGFQPTVASAKFVLDKPNLFSDPDIKTVNGWSLRSMAIHDQTVSSKPASGSIRMDKPTGDGFFSPRFTVKPNTHYTCSMLYKGDVWPSTAMRIGVTYFNADNKKIKNIRTASDWNYEKGGEKKWHRAASIFKADRQTKFVRLLMSKPRSMGENSPVWIDEVYCAEGILAQGKPTPKQAFIGEKVQVYPSGVIVHNGKRTFPRCMFADHQFQGNLVERMKLYVQGGWNCNMWVASLKQADASIKGGMDYFFLALAPYIGHRGWGLKATNFDIDKTIANMLRTIRPILQKYPDRVLGYYYDDEDNTAYGRADKVLAAIAKLDTVNGKRQRPIYILKGNVGAIREDLHHADITGSYTRGGDTGGQGSGASSHLILSHMPGQYLPVMPGQYLPVIFAQVNQGVVDFGPRLNSALTHGVTAVGFWRDQTRNNFWVERQPWWNGFNALQQRLWQAISKRELPEEVVVGNTGADNNPTDSDSTDDTQPDHARDGGTTSRDDVTQQLRSQIRDLTLKIERLEARQQKTEQRLKAMKEALSK